MSKYITEFKQTGISTVNVDLICNNWNDRFFISTWINSTEERYTFIVHSKRKNMLLCKTQISKEQTLEIVNRLNLIHLKNETFRSGGSYHTKAYLLADFEKIKQLRKEKEDELSVLNGMLHSIAACI